MDLKNIFLFITAGVNFGLGFFIILRDWKNKVNISFSVLLLFITSWSFGVAMFRAAQDPTALSAWLNYHYISAALIALSFFYFTRFFPYVVNPVRPRVHMINFIAILALVVLILTSGTIAEIYLNESGDHTVAINYPIYALYTVYFCTYIFISFVQLFRKIRESTLYTRRLITIVFSATLLAAIFGSFFNLFLPLVTYQYIWFGPYFTALMVLIIVRYVFIKKLE